MDKNKYTRQEADNAKVLLNGQIIPCPMCRHTTWDIGADDDGHTVQCCRCLFSLPKDKLSEVVYPTHAFENLDPNKDTKGKYMAGVIADFAPALKEIAKLGSMNNKPNGKYERGSWMKVEDPMTQYNDAFWRHLLEGPLEIDPETNMPHDVAIAWNAIALVWFRLKNEEALHAEEI